MFFFFKADRIIVEFEWRTITICRKLRTQFDILVRFYHTRHDLQLHTFSTSLSIRKFSLELVAHLVSFARS